MNKNIFKLITGILIICLTGPSCKKFLDINTNPNGPEKVDPAIYLAPIQQNYAFGVQFDSRGLGPYIQNWAHTTGTNAWNIHGYNSGSDFGGELWRNVYWRGGQNTLDLLNQSREEKKWDILGVGLALQAWGWQMLTDYHGEIILDQAFSPLQNTFPYTSQPRVYAVVDSLCRAAIVELDKTTDAIGSTTFPRFDVIYRGDRARWKKFVYGLMAINYSHLSNKSTYQPDSVIKFVDNSLSSNNDDVLVPLLGTSSADANFYGPTRRNMHLYLQTEFIVRTMDGTNTGTVKDPRRVVMLTPSTDGVYRGLKPGTTYSSATSALATGIKNIWGAQANIDPAPAGTVGKYLFQDKAPFPLMTYAMLQFIKAEAAFKKGDKALALTAYRNGLNAHLDFVQNGARGVGASPTNTSPAVATFTFLDPALAATFATERAAFLASPLVVPAAADLTLSQILLQKYVALWGWGFIETWSDLRRYDYSSSVFTGFTLPDASILFTDNGGKYAYRVRPRYNSEYIWNIDALTAIGGFDRDFHTKKMWFHQP